MLTIDMLLECTREELWKNIKHVGIYPRRSRKSSENKNMTEEEIEKDLFHQSKRLKDVCDNNKWSYSDYTEIGSGENIDERPRIMEMLEDIYSNKLEAIVVTELSRLTRGGGADMDRILVALRKNGVVIIEGEHNLLNPFNKSDLDRIKMMSMVSNFEYSGYVERITNAKRVRASEGHWVAGTPPYGYIKNNKTKKLDVDEEKGEIYREMILLPYLNGTPTSDIAWKLNKAKIPSPRNGMWENTTILRMLKDETYCGTIIYNKTMGSPNKSESVNRMPYRRMSEDKWSKYYNCHPALKSQEEHQQVMSIINKRGHKQGVIEYHPLSGMVKCSNCGKSMIINNSMDKPRFIGCSCGKNGGGELEVIENVITLSVIQLRDKLMNINETDGNKIEKQSLLKEIEKLEDKIQKENQALVRIDEAVVYGYFTPQQATEKKEEILKLVYELEDRVSRKKVQLNSFNVLSNKEKIKRIDMFIENSDKVNSNEDMRNLYTTIINNIIWNKVDKETLEVKVNFL